MISNKLANYWLATLLNCAKPSNTYSNWQSQYLYLGLSYRNPGPDGANVQEPTDSNYHKIEVDSSRFDAASGKEKKTNYPLFFPKALVDWTTTDDKITYVCLYSNTQSPTDQGLPPSSGMVLLWYGQITDSSGTPTPLSVLAEHVVMIEPGELILAFDHTPSVSVI